MKTQKLRRNRLTSLSNSRWAAYATAGAATAIAGANSAEAAIHYSGLINETFNAAPGTLMQQPFSLDNGGFMNFGHNRHASPSTLGSALFFIGGASVSDKFVGKSAGNYRYPYRLAFGQTIAARPFASPRGNFFATLAAGNGFTYSQWLTAGTGFIAFKFNGGLGVEYGWARVTMNSGKPGNTFTLVDFAWGDPGTTLTVGQTAVPEPGSLGLLALGGAGLLVWRKRHAKSAAV